MTSALIHLPELMVDRMLDCVAEGLIIAAFAWLLLRVFRNQNSSTRFAVWFAALVGIAGLPLFGGSFIANSTTSSLSQKASFSPIVLPSHWALYLLGAWAVLACAGLLRIAIGLGSLITLRRRGAPVDIEALDPVLQRTIADFQSVRSVQLLQSDDIKVPVAIGLFKPAVIIPSWLLLELSVSELNDVLLHELAHLRRYDDWTNLSQRVLGAVLFFHPAVWWLQSKLSLEREMACDDLVLEQTGNPRAYAKCLARLAEKSFVRRAVALGQAAVGRFRQTSFRVARILNVNRAVATRVGKPAVGLVTSFAIVCLLAQPHLPELVVFEDHAQPQLLSANITGPAVPVAAAKAAKFIPVEIGRETSQLKPTATLAKWPDSRELKPEAESAVLKLQPVVSHQKLRLSERALEPVLASSTIPGAIPEQNIIGTLVFVVMDDSVTNDGVWQMKIYHFAVFEIPQVQEIPAKKI